MSERKDWKVATKVLVTDAEYWDDTKTALQDIIWDNNTDYQKETTVLLDGDVGRVSTALTLYKSNQYWTQLNPNNWTEFPAEAYLQMTTSKGYVTQSSDGGAMIGLRINMRSVVDAISPNILKGLDNADDIRKRILALDFSLSGTGTGIVPEYDTSWSGTYNQLSGSWDKFNTSAGLPLSPWDMFAQVASLGLDQYLDDNYCVTMYWYGGGTKVLRDWGLSVEYMLSLTHLWMPRNESYTRPQISSEFVKLISGATFWTDKRPENFTDATNTGTSSNNYNGWDLTKCPHVVYCDFYRNNTSRNSLPTTLSEIMAGVYPVPAYYLGYVGVIKNSRMFFLAPKTKYNPTDGWHLEEDYSKPIVFKFDMIAEMKATYPDLFPEGSTRQQYVDTIKKLNNRFEFKTTMGRDAYNDGSNTSNPNIVYQVPPITVRSFLWKASTSSSVQLKNYTVPANKVTVSPTTGLATKATRGDSITMDLGFTLTDVKSYITDDGYIYWYVISNGYLNTPLPDGDVENVARPTSANINLYKKETDREVNFQENYQIAIKLPDVYEQVVNHEKDIASLQAQIDALKN